MALPLAIAFAIASGVVRKRFGPKPGAVSADSLEKLAACAKPADSAGSTVAAVSR